MTEEQKVFPLRMVEISENEMAVAKENAQELVEIHQIVGGLSGATINEKVQTLAEMYRAQRRQLDAIDLIVSK